MQGDDGAVTYSVFTCGGPVERVSVDGNKDTAAISGEHIFFEVVIGNW